MFKSLKFLGSRLSSRDSKREKPREIARWLVKLTRTCSRYPGHVIADRQYVGAALPQKSGKATPCRLRRLSPFVRGRMQSLILLVLLSPLQRGTAAVGGRGSLSHTVSRLFVQGPGRWHSHPTNRWIRTSGSVCLQLLSPS